MRLLLDTHAFLWFVQADARLSPTAKALIEDPNNKPFISVVSLWEIAIKVSIGKLKLAENYDAYMTRETQRFDLLSIALVHTSLVATLPFQPKHNDPFDRLLIAQALVEQMPLVSNEAMFAAYPVSRLW